MGGRFGEWMGGRLGVDVCLYLNVTQTLTSPWNQILFIIIKGERLVGIPLNSAKINKHLPLPTKRTPYCLSWAADRQKLQSFCKQTPNTTTPHIQNKHTRTHKQRRAWDAPKHWVIQLLQWPRKVSPEKTQDRQANTLRDFRMDMSGIWKVCCHQFQREKAEETHLAWKTTCCIISSGGNAKRSHHIYACNYIKHIKLCGYLNWTISCFPCKKRGDVTCLTPHGTPVAPSRHSATLSTLAKRWQLLFLRKVTAGPLWYGAWECNTSWWPKTLVQVFCIYFVYIVELKKK